MATEINMNEVLSLNKSQTINSVEKLDPVQVIKSLPESGNDLPLIEKKTEFSEDDINDAVREINQYVQSEQRELQFTIDEDSGQTVIKVIDAQTKELVRQIPGEEALNVAQKLKEGANLEIFNSYT